MSFWHYSKWIRNLSRRESRPQSWRLLVSSQWRGELSSVWLGFIQLIWLRRLGSLRTKRSVTRWREVASPGNDPDSSSDAGGGLSLQSSRPVMWWEIWPIYWSGLAPLLAPLLEQLPSAHQHHKCCSETNQSSVLILLRGNWGCLDLAGTEHILILSIIN